MFAELVAWSDLSDLADPRLMREHAYIDGRWCSAPDGAVREIVNPANGECLGRVAMLGADDAKRAVAAAQNAFPKWRKRLSQDRAAILRRWHDLVVANREDLALLMTLEQGKPIREARAEIDYAASFIAWYAEEARRVNVESVTGHIEGVDMIVRREPAGVAALVTPWNFPAAMITRKVAAALAAGCTMVAHPSMETPFSALALAELAERAGMPAGVFNVVTGDAAEVVGAFCASDAVRVVSFTGSTEIGRLIAEQCAPGVKQMVLELGGHAPFIVFPDADIDRAVEGAVAAKFATSGQDCLAANRFYVHRDIYDAFVARFARRTADLTVGDGRGEDVEIGPLIHARAVAKCREHIDDACAHGARLVAGGGGHSAGPLFLEPTVLADVPPEARIWREETFGPVAAFAPFDDTDDVVAMANNTEYGLVAYLFTEDRRRIADIASGLEFGMVAVNRAAITGAPVPFGGVKQSGLGREGGRLGMEAFTEIRYVCIDKS